MQINPIILLLILVYVSWLAFSVGRLYEQLRQMKNRAAQHSVQPTLLTLCPYCKHEHDSRLACPEYAAKSQSN